MSCNQVKVVHSYWWTDGLAQAEWLYGISSTAWSV